MDTELLKTFLEVSRTRHFGRAAEALYLTQSAVSFRIRQLENQLSVELFTRHRNNIRLTPAGERLLPYAKSLMDTWFAAKKEVAQTSQRNEFSIGASPVLWECILGEWLEPLYAKNSNMSYEARIAQRHALIKELHERQLDLLITTEAPKMDEFGSQVLGRFSLALFCKTPKIPLQALRFLRLDWGPDFYHHEAAAGRAANAVPYLTSSSASLVCRMMEPLNGYAWLPAEWAKRDNHLFMIQNSHVIERPLYAVWLQNSDKQLQAQTLLRSLCLSGNRSA